jgi:hypothetical protein
VTIAELRCRSSWLGAGEIEHDDAGAMCCHQARSGESEAVEAGTAGDDGNFVLEQHVFRLQ